MKLQHLSFLTCVLLAPATQAQSIRNFVITGYAAGSSPIMSASVGATTNVPGAGDATNVSATATVNSFVDFTIGDAQTIVGDRFDANNINALPTVATLRVSLNAISSPGGNQSNIMIARTSNSQGLMDVGSLTFLLTGSGGSNSNNLTNSATLGFSWRNANNTAPLVTADRFVFTSYDIDFTQRNTIPTADIGSLHRNPVTNLTTSVSGSNTSITDASPGTSSVFNNAPNAYAFVTNSGDVQQSISVSKVGGGNANNGFSTGGNQLYMFSFRAPSPLIPTVVPEPSSALLISLGSLLLFRRRRA